MRSKAHALVVVSLRTLGSLSDVAQQERVAASQAKVTALREKLVVLVGAAIREAGADGVVARAAGFR